ncbi:phospholipid-transporting ATPase IC-like isoform X1 [Pleurodeles waltl]
MDTSVNREGKKKKKPDYSWEVRANDRAYHTAARTSFLCFGRPKYADNSIKTTKYNVLTFLPLNLIEQFHHAHIIYFTIMVILQGIPMISSSQWWGALIPLSVLLSLRALRNIFEDIARYKSDKTINNRPSEILQGNRFCRKKWKHIKVGDIVCLKKDDLVPADLLLLQSSEPNSLCYVETSSIDGETNLKFRQAPMITNAELSSIPALVAFDGKVICEEPNSKMHTFIGTLEWNGIKYPLDNEKMLLRGCSIRNTANCYGLVIYAGIDTKIMKNSGKAKMKRTKLDLMMNKIVFSVFLMVIAFAVLLSVGSGLLHETMQKKHKYIPAMPPQITPAFYAFLLFWGNIILLNNLVPIILFITIEGIYAIHSLFINWDVEMYYAATDTPATARATSLNDNLGQIEYIFSDKTGTLTQNIMTFRKCCINGRVYGSSSDAEGKMQEVSFRWNPYADGKFQFHDQTLVDTVRNGKEQDAAEFFRLLALCHTVMVEEKEGDLVYQATSPDEEALVTAARNFGYVFCDRTHNTITVSELGVERTYNVLALMDFNSVRKRMSVLVRDPDGKIVLYTKGADDVIFDRLHPDSKSKDAVEKALNTFASETLRTLCIAYKEVEESVYTLWSKKHMEASVTLENRAKKLHAAYEEIETNLELLGVTAIEDNLQDRVPETIELLRKGNIKVWVLTGDKQETAVNIGFSCRLLSEDMEILDENEVCRMLDATLENISSGGKEKDVLNTEDKAHHHQTALVISGEFLSKIMSSDGKRTTRKWPLSEKLEGLSWLKKRRSNNVQTLRERAFVDLASRCQAVVCCRVTPKQKAVVVDMVKRHKKAITLAIGDGGNDINMIKTAHIGVGISGHEGQQAVLASDYALAQFCFLQRLLLVHGRWSYYRICKFLRYYVYKTFAYMLTSIWFSFFNTFSAQLIFDVWFLVFQPLVYTVYPSLCMGVLDQDVGAKTSLRLPELYRVGQTDSLFNYRLFLRAIMYGAFTSLVTFFVPFGAFWDTAGPDGICDMKVFSVTISTAVVLATTIEVSMDISQWNVFSTLAVLISIGFYFLFSYLTQLPSADPVIFAYEDVSINAFSKLYIWLIILLAVAISLLPSLFARCVVRLSSSGIKSKEEETQTEIALEDTPVKLEAYFKRNDWLRRSSSAFSHNEGYAELITRGTSIRKRRLRSPAVAEEKQPYQEEKKLQV